MLRLKIFVIIIFLSLFASNLIAQEDSVDEMMKNSQTRDQVMDYIIAH